MAGKTPVGMLPLFVKPIETPLWSHSLSSVPEDKEEAFARFKAQYAVSFVLSPRLSVSTYPSAYLKRWRARDLSLDGPSFFFFFV